MRYTLFRKAPAVVLITVILAGMLQWQAVFAQDSNARYVFLFIGDGMGSAQRLAAARTAGRELVMDTFPAQGITTTHAADRFITGSAAAGTALACGRKTTIGSIGVDPGGQRLASVAEKAKAAGKRVGIVTSAPLDDATPAVFYAHVPERKQSYAIDIALSGSGFDFFAGGGLRDPDNARTRSDVFLGNAFQVLKRRGYTLLTDNSLLGQIHPGTGKVVAIHGRLPDHHAMPYALDIRQGDVSLAEYTRKAIEVLDCDAGFFIMVEGGKIDWACHANDAATAIHDVLALDEAVDRAVTFYERHPEEVLIVVTADHETGGLSLGCAQTGYDTRFDLLSRQTVSFQQFYDSVVVPFREGESGFEDMEICITAAFGLQFQGSADDPMLLAPMEKEAIRQAFDRSMKEPPSNRKGKKDPGVHVLYGNEDPLTVTLTHILNNKAGIGWTTFAHTGVPVTTSALGVGSSSFQGRYDNTGIALKLMVAMGIDP
ncbi:MAG: alkaline phosphatase [Pseudomonadota bacterium]